MSTAVPSALAGAADRRLNPRLPSLHPGRLFMPDGAGLDVVIVDLSASGARVRLRRMAGVPTDLVLADRTTMIAHRASVVWSRDAELGLRLTRSLSLKGAVPEPLQAARAWCLDESVEATPSPLVFHI